jgi:chromosome segregation ATPase
MVQADISQLSRECNDWRANLRSHRDEISNFKKELQEAAGNSLTKSQLQEVEHYHNQFHIQLINVHDLKQAIKVHDRKIGFEQESAGKAEEDSLKDHENLYDQYQTLETTLQELRHDFRHFLESLHSTA